MAEFEALKGELTENMLRELQMQKYTCRAQSVAIVIEENHQVAKSDGYWRLIFCAERNDKISQS